MNAVVLKPIISVCIGVQNTCCVNMLKGLLIDVSSQHSFKGLGLKASLYNQSALTIKRATCTQLCQQEQLHMLRLPVHSLA